jgi:hypothetical protein
LKRSRVNVAAIGSTQSGKDAFATPPPHSLRTL